MAACSVLEHSIIMVCGFRLRLGASSSEKLLQEHLDRVSGKVHINVQSLDSYDMELHVLRCRLCDHEGHEGSSVAHPVLDNQGVEVSLAAV